MAFLLDDLAIGQPLEKRRQFPLFRFLEDHLYAGDVVDRQLLAGTGNRSFSPQIIQKAVLRLEKLLRHVLGRRQEVTPGNPEPQGPLVRQGVGMPFDRNEDPVDDPTGRFLRQAADPLDPARPDALLAPVTPAKAEGPVKRGLAVVTPRIPVVIADQLVDPFVAVGGVGNQGILQPALDLNGAERKLLMVQLPEDEPGELREVSGYVDVVEVDQPGDQIGIRRTRLIVHPTADDVVEHLPVHKAVDLDHDPPEPETAFPPRGPAAGDKETRSVRLWQKAPLLSSAAHSPLAI